MSSLFFRNSPSPFSDLEEGERSSKLFHYWGWAKREKMVRNGWSFIKKTIGRMQSSPKRKDDSYHPWLKTEKEIEKVDLFIFPLDEWKHIWKFFRVEISQLNEEKAQQSSGAVRCVQTEETARSLKQKSRKQRRTFISVFHKSHPNCINKINKRKQVLEG